jgi:hypothetical protein
VEEIFEREEKEEKLFVSVALKILVREKRN